MIRRDITRGITCDYGAQREQDRGEPSICQERPDSSEGQGIGKPLALVVGAGEALANTLAAAGFEIVQMRTGREALVYLTSTISTLMVAVLHPPDMSGVELLRHIRADERLAEVEVIITGARPSPARFAPQERG